MSLSQLLIIIYQPKRNPSDCLNLGQTETGFSEKELECWLRAINRKRQAIIYGSPGTGKTFIAEKFAKQLIGDYGFYELVQFHPATLMKTSFKVSVLKVKMGN